MASIICIPVGVLLILGALWLYREGVTIIAIGIAVIALVLVAGGLYADVELVREISRKLAHLGFSGPVLGGAVLFGIMPPWRSSQGRETAARRNSLIRRRVRA